MPHLNFGMLAPTVGNAFMRSTVRINPHPTILAVGNAFMRSARTAPSSHPVGNGLCAVPTKPPTFSKYPDYLKGANV